MHLVGQAKPDDRFPEQDRTDEPDEDSGEKAERRFAGHECFCGEGHPIGLELFYKLVPPRSVALQDWKAEGERRLAPTEAGHVMNPRSHSRTQRLVARSVLLLALNLAGCGGESISGPGESYPDTKLRELKPGNKGVVLAWRKDSTPVDDKVNEIAVGQTLLVRVRNLDGWLITKLLDNRITGEPDMTPTQRNNYALLDKISKDKGGALAVLKRYEAFEQPALASSPAPADAATPSPTPTPLEPLPTGVKAKDLRAAFNAYEALLNTVKRQLFLVLNNSQFRQLKAENPDARVTNAEAKANPDDTVHQFEFRLRRRPGDEEAWGSLYDGTRAVHDVRVSLGVELDGRVFVLETGVFPQALAPVQRVRLELFRAVWLWNTLGGLLLIFFLFVYLGKTTPLLRDLDLPMRADGYSQFSLSRLQLAFWTYLVVGAFLIIWLVTDRLDTLNTTVLTLLGISSGTTFASKLASMVTLEGGRTRLEPARAARQHEPVETLRTRLQKELTELTDQAAKIERASNQTAAQEKDLSNIGARIGRLQDDLEYLKHNRFMRFLIDLLSENGRVTLHRMQIVLWTGVLGFVFISRVKRELSMPTFSETLLGLMGLSSLTYIALKVPELKKVEADVKASTEGKKAGKGQSA